MDLSAFYGAFSPACFALPGLMSMFALIDVQTSGFWRVSFGVISISGVVIMALVRGYPVAPGRDHPGLRGLPAADQLGLAAYVTAIVLYLIMGCWRYGADSTHCAPRRCCRPC